MMSWLGDLLSSIWGWLCDRCLVTMPLAGFGVVFAMMGFGTIEGVEAGAMLVLIPGVLYFIARESSRTSEDREIDREACWAKQRAKRRREQEWQDMIPSQNAADDKD